MTQIIQQLTVFLKGGQNIIVPFNAEKADVLNPQIEAFIKAIGDKEKNQGNFLFQGARVVLVHLPDVSAVDVVSGSIVQKEPASAREADAAKAPAKAKKAE